MTRVSSPPSRTGRPVVEGFEPLRSTDGTELWPLLAEARRKTPVFYMPGYDMWCVTRYDDARAILRDYKRFSTEPYAPQGRVPDDVKAIMGPDYCGPITSDTLLPSSPPKHSRVRHAFQPSWSAKSIARYEDVVRAYANELIDTFVEDEHADLATQFAGPFVVGVISDLLGLPKEWRARFRDYTEAMLRTSLGFAAAGEEQARADWETIMDVDRRFIEFIHLRRREPADDLTTDAIQTNGDDGNLLTDDEILRNVQGFAMAGADTAANGICTAVNTLLKHPDQFSEIQQDRSLLPNAIEEVMRMWAGAPTQGLFRKALTDVEVGGVTIPEGSVLFIYMASCQHDETKFSDPDKFDIHRPDAKDNIGFGRGIHLCLGAPLARLEMRVALECFMDRLPNLRLSDPDAPLEFAPNLLIAKLLHLKVEWD